MNGVTGYLESQLQWVRTDLQHEGGPSTIRLVLLMKGHTGGVSVKRTHVSFADIVRVFVDISSETKVTNLHHIVF